MSIITDNIGVAKSVTVDLPDTPLDGRTRCDSVDDFPSIEHPFVGMQIYTITDGKTWVVKTLASKVINGITFPNMVIKTYEEVGSGSGGGGVEYTAGNGILISESNEISVDTESVATQATVDAVVGKINTMLDSVNGEVLANTTADKINAITNSKVAIREKFKLDATLPFSQYADNITAGGGEYYLCTYVNRTYASYDFTVSGVSETLFATVTDWNGDLLPEQYRNINPNGTYTPYKQSADGVINWRWKNENNCYCYYSHMQMGWVFTPIDDSVVTDIGIGTFPVYASASMENTPYPWDSTLSWTDGSGTAVSFTIAQVIPEAVEQYWEGYKLELNDNDKYDIDYSEEHKLTYADFMPVAGRIYDETCIVEINGLDIAEKYKLACPYDMTSNENEDWVITSAVPSTWEGSERPAWQAFDADRIENINGNGTVFCTSEAIPWLQWESKNGAVFVGRLEVTVNTNNSYYDDGISFFGGSNDGKVWYTPKVVSSASKNITGDIYTYTKVYDTDTPYKMYRLETKGNMVWDVMAYTPFASRDVPTTKESTVSRTPLVFNAPLTEQENPLPTGQNAYYSGSYSFTEIDGRKCVYLENAGHIYSGSVGTTRIPDGDKPVTIGFWVKATTATPARSGIFGYGANNKGQAFYVELRDGTVGVASSANADDGNGLATTTFDASSWHFIAVVHQPGMDYFYIDGSAAGTYAITRTTVSQNCGYYIGRLTNSSTYPFNGYISNVQVYDVALTADEVAEWYADDGNVIDFE